MGADSFSAWYGLRFEIDVSNVDTDTFDRILAPYELETEPRMVAARAAGLAAWMDRDTDGGTHFLAVGTDLASLGIEGDSYAVISDAGLAEIQFSTRAKLVQAGFAGNPELHLQLIAQY